MNCCGQCDGTAEPLEHTTAAVACVVCGDWAEDGYDCCTPCREATCLVCGEVAEDADRLRAEGCLACRERAEDTERIEFRKARGRVR